jgi:hypothetical protein
LITLIINAHPALGVRLSGGQVRALEH